MNGSLREFMSEKKIVSRWIILISAMVGAFAGAVLMFLVALLGIVA